MWEDGETLYIPHPPALEQMHSHKLEMSIAQLQEQNILGKGLSHTLQVLDKNVNGKIMLIVNTTP